MMAKIVKMNDWNRQTLSSPGIDEKKVVSKLRILLSWCIDRSGLKTRAVLKTFKLLSLDSGVKVTKLDNTIKKSMQFHASLR